MEAKREIIPPPPGELSDGTRVEVGAALLTTGVTHFDSINEPEWGFGLFPDVVTTPQVEQMISSSKNG